MLPVEATSSPTPVLAADRAVTWATTEVSLKEPRLGCVMQLQVPWADEDVESYVAIAAMVKVIEETFSGAKYLAEEAHYDIMLTHLHASCIRKKAAVTSSVQSPVGWSRRTTIAGCSASRIAPPASTSNTVFLT